MADHTAIEWADATWNPITGCSVTSAGCRNCYAMQLAGTRLQQHPSRAGLTRETAAGPVWTGEVRLNPEWIDQPMRWKKARRIFVCAHGDLFHEAVPEDWIDRVFSIMVMAQQHTFQVLTKRADRMLAYLQQDRREHWAHQAIHHWGGKDPDRLHDSIAEAERQALPNVWLGVSVENQAAAEERVPLLLQTPAAVRWISAEPLLGPVDLTRISLRGSSTAIDALKGGAWAPVLINPGEWSRVTHHPFPLDWVVVGGESGTGARPMHPDWARSLRDQCAAAGVPLVFKQWGEWMPALDAPADTLLPADRWCAINPVSGITEEGPCGAFANRMARVGKARTGRLLDGVLHDAYPEVA